MTRYESWCAHCGLAQRSDPGVNREGQTTPFHIEQDCIKVTSSIRLWPREKPSRRQEFRTEQKTSTELSSRSSGKCTGPRGALATPEALRSRSPFSCRALPWVRIAKEYVFDAREGRVTLSDLFDGRSQLIVKHYMMAPGQKNPCVGCAFEADHVEPALVHLQNHDVSYAAIARAPIEEIDAFRQRMGWRFRFVSSLHSDFNYDFNVSFAREQTRGGMIYYSYQYCQIAMEDLSGRSVFYKNEDGDIFHTYSSFGRGAEELETTYAFLDLTPKGRQENGPYYNFTDWVRPHDMYGKGGTVEANARYHPAEEASVNQR